MMDDRFLHEQREAPRAGWGRALREHLRGVEDAAETRRSRLRPVLEGAFTVAAVAVAFTFPAVRVAAQNALDLFRVRSFAGVEIDESRIEQLRRLNDDTSRDPAMLVFDEQEVLQDPGKPVEHPSADLAGSAAGLPRLLTPGTLPSGFRFEKAVVEGEGAVRLTVRTERLREMLAVLGLNDVRVPQGFDGQTITVRKPAVVSQRFTNGTRTIGVVEAMSPEVMLPPGADLEALGELGLRVLGLDAAEARRVAASVDWRSTLLVPVPTSAGSFRLVDVNGHRALFIRTNPEPKADGTRGRRGALVMWSDGGRVHAVQGDIGPEELLEFAQSLR
jgi:hypothetical protein